MALKDWPPLATGETVASAIKKEREEARAACIRARHLLLMLGLGIIIGLMLAGCGISPELQRAAKIAEHQDCVQRTGSYPQCKEQEVYK